MSKSPTHEWQIGLNLNVGVNSDFAPTLFHSVDGASAGCMALVVVIVIRNANCNICNALTPLFIAFVQIDVNLSEFYRISHFTWLAFRVFFFSCFFFSHKIYPQVAHAKQTKITDKLKSNWNKFPLSLKRNGFCRIEGLKSFHR